MYIETQHGRSCMYGPTFDKVLTQHHRRAPIHVHHTLGIMPVLYVTSWYSSQHHGRLHHTSSDVHRTPHIRVEHTIYAQNRYDTHCKVEKHLFHMHAQYYCRRYHTSRLSTSMSMATCHNIMIYVHACRILR